MKELMVALMMWASPVVGLPVPEEMPVVVFLDQCTLQEVADRECKDDELIATGAHYRGMIMLLDDWDAEDNYDVSILLHELIHYMQYVHKVSPTPCVAAAWEQPAYSAQFKWLREKDLDPLEESGLNHMRLMFLINCVPRI